MATYQFLSDEWLDEARTIRAEYEGRAPPSTTPIRMNLVITEVPFGDGTVEAHVDTTTGELVLDTGHIDPVDLKVTARLRHGQGHPGRGQSPGRHPGLHVRQDQGRGDIAKLMALQSAAPDPSAAEIAARILAITE